MVKHDSVLYELYGFTGMNNFASPTAYNRKSDLTRLFRCKCSIVYPPIKSVRWCIPSRVFDGVPHQECSIVYPIKSVRLCTPSKVFDCVSHQECSMVYPIKSVRLCTPSRVFDGVPHQKCSIVYPIKSVRWCTPSKVFDCVSHQECSMVYPIKSVRLCIPSRVFDGVSHQKCSIVYPIKRTITKNSNICGFAEECYHQVRGSYTSHRQISQEQQLQQRSCDPRSQQVGYSLSCSDYLFSTSCCWRVLGYDLLLLNWMILTKPTTSGPVAFRWI